MTAMPSSDPNLSPPGAPDVETTNVAPSSGIKQPGFIDLPRGKELNETSAMALACSRPVEWIVIAGPVGCGKTTMLTSLYEMFQWGPVEGCTFAGSNTLPAFEERCHLSRMASESIEPDTPRTLYDPAPSFLHLRLRVSESNASPLMDFLFADVSGEMFEHARDSIAACRELGFLRRAGNFLLLLDSEKAVHLQSRWAMVEDAKSLLRSCLHGNMLTDDCVVNIAWSRFDYFAAEGDGPEHQRFRHDVESAFRNEFQTCKYLFFKQVAARPTKFPSLGFGNGVKDLLKGWVTFRPRKREMNLLPSFSGTRESELFARRHLASMPEL